MSDLFELPTDQKKTPLPVSSDFELPGATATQAVTNPDFEITPAPKQDFTLDINSLIANSPDPEKLRKIAEQANAFNQMFGMSIDESFARAQTINNLKAPKPKKFGQAIADNWKAQQLTVQLGELGNQIMKDGETPELMAKYKAIEAELPTLEDVEPAVGDSVIGKVGNFLRRTVVQGSGLVSQQIESIKQQDTQKTFSTFVGATLLGGLMTEAGISGKDRTKLLASIASGATSIGRQESGGAYMSMRGAGIPREIALPIANGVGSLNSIIEFAGASTFISLFPGADKVARGVLGSIVKKAGFDVGIKNLALKMATKAAAGFTEQMGEEFSQQMVTYFGQEIGAEVAQKEYGLTVEQQASLGTQLKQVLDQAGPGMFLFALAPAAAAGVAGIGKPGVKVTEKAKVGAAPTPMKTVRTDVAKAVEAKTPEAAQAVITQAEDAKVAEIAKADVVTPQMVNDAVELADMYTEMEEQTQVAEASPIAPQIETFYHGTTSPDFTSFSEDKPVYLAQDKTEAQGFANNPLAGGNIKDAGGQPRTLEVMAKPGLTKNIDTEIQDAVMEEGKTPEEVIQDMLPELKKEGVRYVEFYHPSTVSGDTVDFKTRVSLYPQEDLTIGKTPDIQSSVASGAWVDDLTLGQFASEPWAQDEIATRQDLRDVASYLADTGQATSFDSFVAAAKEIELTPKSEEYYRGIWDSTAKPEAVVDEEGKVDEEAQIDANVVAEEKQAKKAPVTDRLLGELEATPMWNPATEKVSDVLTAKEIKPATDVAGEELNTAQMSNDLLRKKKKLVQRMTNDFLKKPSAGIGSDAVRALRALQEPYTAKETKNLKKAKDALTAWQTAHPGQPLVPEAQAILAKRGIKDISISELIDLWKQSRDIRKEGAAKEKARREAIKARRVQMATDMQSTIPGGMSVKRLEEFAKATAQEKEKAFARKGKIRASALHPLRIFKALGAAFEEAFWNERKTWEGKAAIRVRGWDRVITDLKKKTGFGVDDAMHKVPGTEYYVDDLMTYYIQMKDPNGRKAVLYGNDENEANISRLTAALPQKVRDFLDGIIAENNKEYGDVERVQIESKGIAAPKVDNYMPIRRIEDFGKPFAEEIAKQAAVRESARIAGNQKGFTNQRVNFKEGTQQARFRTDFLNILAEQITQETQFIESEQWSSDMKWLLEGKAKESKAFLEAMKQKHGQPVITFLKDYVNAVVQPESFNGQSFAGLTSRIFRNLSDAQLMYKLATVFIQVEGPFRSLAALDLNQWHYLIAGLWKGTLSPNKSAEFVYSKAPDMMNMAESAKIDPAIQEGRGFKHSTEAGMFLQKAHKGLREGGYFLLGVMNKWTVISEWTAVYYANVKKLGEEGAIKAASDAVYMHQPSGKLADAPRMYWKAKGNSLLAFLQRFSRASNQMGQMIFADLPKAIKEKKIGNMLGIVTAVAVSAYLQFLRTNKRPPKDPEEYAQAALNGLGDSLGAMTFGFGGAATSRITGAYQGGDIKPYEIVNQMTDIAIDSYYGNISEKQITNMLKQIMQTTGLPFGAAENLARSAYDWDTGEFRFDPIELFGRRPKE